MNTLSDFFATNVLWFMIPALLFLVMLIGLSIRIRKKQPDTAKTSEIEERVLLPSDETDSPDHPHTSRHAGQPEQIASTSGAQFHGPECRQCILLPDFKQTFLVPVEYKIRSSLYVSADTKRKILEVVKKIGGERMTAISYVENILRHHLELYKDEINRIHKEQNSQNII